jgi:hypothetical protein
LNLSIYQIDGYVMPMYTYEWFLIRCIFLTICSWVVFCGSKIVVEFACERI